MSYSMKYPEPAGWDHTVMADAVRAVRRARYVNHPLCNEHDWWVARFACDDSKPLHPAIEAFVKQWRPLDWQRLLLEWPHVSKTDPSRIAYTPSQAYGEADRQLVTGLGKYLNKHWPHVPDHVRRDAVAGYSFDEMTLVYTTPEIIQGIELGPRSCMQSGYGSIPFKDPDKEAMLAWFADKARPEPDWDLHPYSLYAPEYGWHMALRKKDGEFLGRALCLEHEGEKLFVRTYSRRSGEESQSSSDHVLQQWLQAKGYELVGEWPEGARLLRKDHPHGGGPFVPYIDGASDGDRRVSAAGGFLVIDYSGELLCNNTNGRADDADEREVDYHCSDCGAAIYEDDDHLWVGHNEEETVCENCADNYTSVRGGTRIGGWTAYYIRNADAEELQCGSYYIDPDRPPDGVVQLEDGRWAKEDDTVYINDEFYLIEDEDVCELASDWDHERWALKENCWQCAGTEKWYHEDDTDDQVDIDGETYHRDYLSTLANARQIPLPLPAYPQNFTVAMTNIC